MKKILCVFLIMYFSIPVVYAKDVCKEIDTKQFTGCCKMSDRPTSLDTIFSLCEVTDVYGNKREVVAEFNRETGECVLVQYYDNGHICR